MAEPSGQAPGPGSLRAGPYRLLGLVGRGGMGDVYRAVRDDDHFRKTVALKVVRPGASRSPSEERLRSERQILACLEHPGIARLLDGGTMADGRPYLVMEFVAGERLDAYVEARQLEVRARVELFRTVCDAVQHAHRNLVVHRDLKPANILVTAEGVPKLLDFGVAKLLGGATAADGTVTICPPMTPAYASPEQIRGEPVTTASDVYSLGAVLYELVAGVRPHGCSGAALRLAVCEQEPERPSAARRRAQPPAPRGLVSDLDAIVMKALHKQPKHRYPTVDALSEDLRRCLAGLPVSAARGTLAYRARRFVGRNRMAVGLGAAVVVLAVAYAANDRAKARRLARERDRAQHVTSFLVDLFQVPDAGEERGGSVTAREMLDRGAEQIGSALQDEPDLRAGLLDALGGAHQRLGLYQRAAELYRGSLEEWRRAGGSRGRDVARTLSGLGEALYYKGDLPGAEAAHGDALELRRQAFGRISPEAAESLVSVAKALRARTLDLSESEILLTEAVAIQRRVLPADDPRLAVGLTHLAYVQRDRGDYRAAEALHRECLDNQRRAYGTGPHPAVAGSLNDLGVVLFLSADDARAEPLFRECLEMRARLYGSDHVSIPPTLANLAALLRVRAGYTEAEALLRRAVSISERFHGADGLFTAPYLGYLGALLCDAGDCVSAEALQRRAVAITRARLGPLHPTLSGRLAELGGTLKAQGRHAEAEVLLQEALAAARTARPAGGLRLAETLMGLADVQARRGDPRALATATEGIGICRRLLPPGHPVLAEAESVLGGALRAAGRLQEAEPLLRASHALLVARRWPRPRAARDAAARLAAADAGRQP